VLGAELFEMPTNRERLSAPACRASSPRSALEKHCHEAAVIVQEFAGGWFAKNNYQGTLNPTTAQNFADYALKKMCDELRARRAADA
jgi:hypothetical protein